MCLCEFGLELDYTYDMSWAEFRIRLYGHNRKEKNEWFKVRELAWASLIGSHVDPKKLPKSKEKFIPLEGKIESITELMKDRIRDVRDKYLNQIDNG
jgi:hypothetical protein